MDRIKKEIEERKRKIAEEKAAVAAAGKYVKRGDIEKAQAIREEPQPQQQPPTVQESKVQKEEHQSNNNNHNHQATTERKCMLPKQEVINRLRQRKQPVTLFGETDLEREDRLRALEVSDPKGEHTGQENDFGAELERLEEESSEKPVITASKEDEIKITLTEDSVLEDRIIYKFQGWMREWAEELEQQSETMKKTAQGKTALVTYLQTKKYLSPFYKVLQARQVPEDVVNHVYEISKFLEQREYLKANDTYLRLAIGNAPWPMGVTAVGIHERSGREKLFTNRVAHIMNDETQRKYIQSIKRIITFLQKKYPTDPSKSMG